MTLLRITPLAAVLAIALSACSGQQSPPPAEPVATPEATPAETAPAADAVDAAATAPVSGDCAFNLEGNDAMQFNAKEIVVPASCSEFTINLEHTGSMPVAAMGHNVVITKEADMGEVDKDGIAAGAASDYVKAGDDRVIAHSKMIGGGEKTSVTFDVSKIATGGPYGFFCSFPGHFAMMQGSIRVE
ncbi:MAG: azurin [Pseudoxanthomonas suwonensis]|nr:azurin [Pseudoxanthomonas suwonensis]